ncbi:MAG: extracellular solute-binding protein [Eubacteriales bacterium]|nr:extracellular solute-binding protein [Eubacteriales bacterium]
MKRKVLALALAGAMVCSFAGCGSSASSEAPAAETAAASGEAAPAAEEEAAPAAADGEAVTIKLLHFKTEVADQIEDAAKAYTAEHPNVTVAVTCSSDYNADLKAAMSSSDMPTIYCLDGPEDLKEWDGYVEDLSAEPWVDSVFDGYLDNMTKDGKIYGLPMTVEGYGFIYNKAMFEAAGVDLTTCQTVEDFDAAFGTLKEKIDAGELADEFPALTSVVSFPVGEGWVPGLHTSNIFLAAEFDGDVTAASAGSIEFKYADDFKKLVDLQVKYTEFADDPTALNAVDYSAQVSALITESCAVIQQGNWVASEVMNADPDLFEKLDMVAMPITEGYNGKLPVGVNTNLCVNAKADAAQIAAAKDFLTWLYTSETGKDFVYNQFGFIPVMSGYEDFEITNPLIKAIMNYSADGNTINWVISAYPSGWSDGVCGMNIQKYIGGQESWEDGIADDVAQWSALAAQ